MIDQDRALPGLRRLASGLIAYGIVGLVVAVIGLVALTQTAGRIARISDGLTSEAGGLARILDRTGSALEDAADTARSFSTTVDRTGPAVRQAGQAVAAIVPRLRELEAEANRVNILGARPLAQLGGLFGEIAVQIDGLDVQLTTIAEDLTSNQAALATNATSLRRLAGEVRSLEERLTSDRVAAGLEDAEGLLLLVLALFVAWAVLPAAGALVLGIWLRRLVVPRPVPVPVEPPG